MRSSNLIFLVLLFFVSCNTELIDINSEIDLENVPAFLELSSHPVSQAFFSAVALRMRESAENGGFQKVMALINELIRDNRRQIQKINKIVARVEGECVVTKQKLNDRARFFSGQRTYFHSRGGVSVEEKGEAINVLATRKSHGTAYAALLNAATVAHQHQEKKWGNRIQMAKNAVSKVTAALTAVNEWTPKTHTAFIQQLVKESVDAYVEVKNYPLSIPNEMVQLAANDVQLKKRLYQWLNLLKGSLVESLAGAEGARKEIDNLYNRMRANLQQLNGLLADDAKKLNTAIENYTTLIKVYDQNEKIYANLEAQNNVLTQDTNKWCLQEMNNFKANHKIMENQLKVFVDLKLWLRKNFHRVREWLRKKYH